MFTVELGRNHGYAAEGRAVHVVNPPAGPAEDTLKFTLLTELYHAVQEGGRSLRFDAATIRRASYDEAEEALQVTTKPTLYIIRNIDDPNPYFRGMISEVGYDIARVPFVKPERKRGKTKNNFLTLFDLAMLGITNHSRLPIRLATALHRYEGLSMLLLLAVLMLVPGVSRELIAAAVGFTSALGVPREAMQAGWEAFRFWR